MKGLQLGPCEEHITWPNQVVSRNRKKASTPNLKPQTSSIFSRFHCSLLTRTGSRRFCRRL